MTGKAEIIQQSNFILIFPNVSKSESDVLPLPVQVYILP